jgi:hypothetical protein
MVHSRIGVFSPWFVPQYFEGAGENGKFSVAMFAGTTQHPKPGLRACLRGQSPAAGSRKQD